MPSLLLQGYNLDLQFFKQCPNISPKYRYASDDLSTLRKLWACHIETWNALEGYLTFWINTIESKIWRLGKKGDTTL